jgi:putative transposase
MQKAKRKTAIDLFKKTRDLSPSTVWEGRFRSCLAQSEEYVLACYRYIELNPVRANMVHRPEDYRWSSYRANALGKRHELIEPHEQYLRLAGKTWSVPEVCKEVCK